MPRRRPKAWEVSFRSSEALRQELEERAPRRPSSGRACQGPCNARHRRAQAALDAYAGSLARWQDSPVGPPPPEPAVERASPWPGDPIYCPRCTSLIRRELAELDDLAALRLAGADGHRRGPAGERVAGSRGTPSPSPATDDIDELSSTLRGWESVGRGMDATPPRRGFLAREITTVVAWLVAHFDEMIADGDYAVDYATEIRQWHKRLREAERAGTGRHHLPVPCRRCGEKSLEAEDGSEHIECVNQDFGAHGGRCGLLLSREEYDAEAAGWLARRGAPASPAA
jgi:hypothetical protein